VNKIIRDNNWCEIDMLDGKVLTDGELLFVRFPDGTARGHQIKVKAEPYQIMEQGNGRYDARRSIAYAPVDYHGVVVLVPLVGLEARRV
jgi:hypothetical protein